MTAEWLTKELLPQNSGTKVTQKLQKLVLGLARVIDADQKPRIGSTIRNEGHHRKGRAVHIGNEEIADHLLNVKQVATDVKVVALVIDEIIFDAGGDTVAQRNRWNDYPRARHEYDADTLAGHGNHIHCAVQL